MYPKIFMFMLSLTVITSFAQTNTLKPGNYKANASGQKILLKVGENNQYEMAFLYGQYSMVNDTVVFNNQLRNESSFDLKNKLDAPQSSDLKLQFKTSSFQYVAEKIYIGVQKNDSTPPEYKSLLDYVDKNNFNRTDSIFTLSVDKPKYLYLVDVRKRKDALTSKYQINETMNLLEVDYTKSELGGLELKGYFDKNSNKLKITDGRNPILFSFEPENETATKDQSLLVAVENKVEKNWLVNNGFVTVSDEAYFGDNVNSEYKFKHNRFKTYEEARIKAAKDEDKFLVLVYDKSKEGKKVFDNFLKTNEANLSNSMYEGYNVDLDHYNFYFITDKDQKLISKYAIKEQPAMIVLNADGDMIYHTKGNIVDHQDNFNDYINIYTDLKNTNKLKKLDDAIVNKKTTLQELKMALKNSLQYTIPTPSDLEYDGYVVDTTAVAVDTVAAIDTTVVVKEVAETASQVERYYRIKDRENLYALKASKETIHYKWSQIVDDYIKTKVYDQDFVDLCQYELEKKGFDNHLFGDDSKLFDAIDFRILDYLYDQYAIASSHRGANLKVPESEFMNAAVEYIPYTLNTNCSSYYNPERKNLDKSLDYFKRFLQLTHYRIDDVDNYLSFLKENVQGDNASYINAYSDYYNFVIKDNRSVVECLDAVYDFENGYGQWTEFKEKFSSLANSAAWSVVENKNGAAQIKKALQWSATSLVLQNQNYYFLDTYAQLLYRNNEKDKAIIYEQKAIDAAINAKSEELVEEYSHVLQSMKDGTY